MRKKGRNNHRKKSFEFMNNSFEYIWVNIECILDWMLSQNSRNKLPLNTVGQLA